MKVIIVEDEIAASENLAYLLNEIDSAIEIVTVLDSVKNAVNYFSKPTDADLVLMDIHLADGVSFEIFEQVELNIPIIFTTAYDQYAIKAFKVNSIDYLLKPIDQEELSDALTKFRNQKAPTSTSSNQIEGLLSLLNTQKTSYKSTYLVTSKNEMKPVATENIAMLYIDMGVIKAITFDNKKYSIDSKLEDVETELNPKYFYRVNRQMILQKKAIESIEFYFNGKLIVNTNPLFNDRIVVSKAKATAFKNWMNS
ncbi:MAG: LytTR family DNA-binding domain-containing protein [Urechidicola sp.]|nr:LytTR family DNA-binding domain-containing protein [Urechidicola sp.]